MTSPLHCKWVITGLGYCITTSEGHGECITGSVGHTGREGGGGGGGIGGKIIHSSKYENCFASDIVKISLTFSTSH